MFDGLCILLALFLFYKAEKGYRDIAFFVLCFFVVSDVFYHYFFLDLRDAPGNGWIIFQFYNAINVAIIWKLWKLMSPLFIRRVLATNVLLNIVVSYYFISDSVSDLVYTMYEYPAGFLMILCLFFLWMISYGIRLGNSKVNHTGVVCSLLRYCLRNRGGGRMEIGVQASRSER